MPPCRVSLAKLSLPAELSPCPLTATPTATPTSKKIKLEADVEADDRLHPSQDTKPGLDTKCNVTVKTEAGAGASLLARLKAEPALSSAAVKLELAQLDSQLAAGKLLLDSASHQLRDMLLLDKINSRLYSKIMENMGPGYTVKHEAEESKTAIDEKVEITKNNHNNNNVNEKKPREKSASTEYSDEEYVTCKWKGCDNRMEVQHLLEHLMVSTSSNHHQLSRSNMTPPCVCRVCTSSPRRPCLARGGTSACGGAARCTARPPPPSPGSRPT